MVRSPLMAARATFALKAGEWFRRGRLLMVSPVHGDYRRCQAEIPLIVLCRFPEPALNELRNLRAKMLPKSHCRGGGFSKSSPASRTSGGGTSASILSGCAVAYRSKIFFMSRLRFRLFSL